MSDETEGPESLREETRALARVAKGFVFCSWRAAASLRQESKPKAFESLRRSGVSNALGADSAVSVFSALIRDNLYLLDARMMVLTFRPKDESSHAHPSSRPEVTR